MKILVYKIGEAIIVLLGVFILGLLIPLVLTSLMVLLTNAHFTEGINSIPFWIFTLIGWVCAGVYMNEQVKKV